MAFQIPGKFREDAFSEAVAAFCLGGFNNSRFCVAQGKKLGSKFLQFGPILTRHSIVCCRKREEKCWLGPDPPPRRSRALSIDCKAGSVRRLIPLTCRSNTTTRMARHLRANSSISVTGGQAIQRGSVSEAHVGLGDVVFHRSGYRLRAMRDTNEIRPTHSPNSPRSTVKVV